MRFHNDLDLGKVKSDVFLCINIFNYILNIDLRFEFKVYSFVDERDSDILHLETSS